MEKDGRMGMGSGINVIITTRGYEMKEFKQWWKEQGIFCGEGGMEAAELAFDAATEMTAKRCKEIAQQRYLAENQAVEIDKKISAEFGV